jgi:hypothetical protein
VELPFANVASRIISIPYERSRLGAIDRPSPVLLFVGAFSAYDEALVWARGQLEGRYGPIARQSLRFRFSETDYYEPTMGSDLLKQFFAFAQLVDPEQLATIKHQTNALETAYQDLGRHPVSRPLNLDPGYLDEGKLVLASTKDHAHRLYLGRGIYGEVTLRYEVGRFLPWPWTYPDYRRPDYHAFFADARAALRRLKAREDR